MSVRRKRYRVLVLASLVAGLVVPVGFALSLEAGPGWHSSALPEPSAVPAGIAATVVVPSSGATEIVRSFSHPVPDAAKLFIIGSALLGLAAAVRKAS